MSVSVAHLDKSAQITLYFDQYSRYRSAAEAVQLLCESGDTVLDVGSGQQCVLGEFLPDLRVSYLDPLLAKRAAVAGDEHFIPYSLNQINPDEHVFDIVVTVDTLEHVPPERRRDFLERLSRMARKGLVLSMPCVDVGCAREVDEEVNAVYRDQTGEDYPWLVEHSEYDLPELKWVRRQLSELGWQSRTFGNGRGPWIKDVLVWVISILDRPSLRRVLEDINGHYNNELYLFEHLSPSYRQVVLARKSEPPVLPERLPDDENTRRQAQQAWSGFRRTMVTRLAGSMRELSCKEGELAEQLADQSVKLRDSHNRVRKLSTQLDELRKSKSKEGELAGQPADQSVRLRALRNRVRKLSTQLDELRKSKSWRLTWPLRVSAHLLRVLRRRGPRCLARVIEKMGKYFYHHLPINDRLRWTLTRAFFLLFGLLLRETDAWHAYQQELTWRRGMAGMPKHTIRNRLAYLGTGLEDVIIWGVIDWHFRIQRPQHLVMGLAAKGRRVFYISPQFVNRPAPGFSAERIEGVQGDIYSVRLHVPEGPPIYQGEPDGDAAEHILQGLRRLMEWGDIRRAISVVDHPGWRRFAYAVPDSRIIYDCMDHHQGFLRTGQMLIQVEHDLIARSELVVVSSSWLYDHIHRRNEHTVLIRNACDPEHFTTPPETVHTDPGGRKTIGYYGAIAEWFDANLLYEVATEFSDCRVLLVGSDSADVLARLDDLPNVESHGEVPYSILPQYLHGMDVCLIPFLLTELTHATNPVKIYEYLAACKPVVATDLPELRHPNIAPLIYRAQSTRDFLDGVQDALAECPDDPIRRKRNAFAAEQNWASRVDTMEKAFRDVQEPLVSIILVTWNNLHLTRACVESLLERSDYSNFEMIFVDNASSDETPQYLRELESRHSNVRVILNETNRGFAPANNQGLAVGSGEYLVMLNNDTQVTPGWLRTLVGHLWRDPSIGLLGPVTNRIGNEARVQTSYTNTDEMVREARLRSQRYAGKVSELPVTAFFCVIMPRKVYQNAGPLDENYQVGFFEDDDYCQRVRRLGRRICCAEDAFVHHELNASFAKVDENERKSVFEKNKAYYESKWGAWQRHRYREVRRV